MKKIINAIKSWLAWTFSREVLNVINSGATYEEVDALVQSLIEK